MADKIHCDLLEIYGPDWVNIQPSQIECLVRNIHQMDELLGTEPELYGFVGTQRIGSIIGGYFAIQYEEDEWHYDKKKRLDIRRSTPFARLFFIVFANSGKLLLQNTKFVNNPALNMTIASRLFRNALDAVLAKCNLRTTIDLYNAPSKYEHSDFLNAFRDSSRVIKLRVTNLNADHVPTNLDYYNPQREKNSIIRESHKHDYSHLKKVDLEADSDGDLRETHLAKDLIHASQPQSMTYVIDLEEYIMRREITHKFEFYVDMNAKVLPERELEEIINKLRKEQAIFLDTPTSTQAKSGQMSLFESQKLEGKEGQSDD
ncbi:hypothetical protein [Candidatus Leptofilum sp.]|uniref:hypothetical protein n=1 Tax=Candidatus Leptofilum sp. TaxID=3241576 RepID=UPI003B58CD4D